MQRDPKDESGKRRDVCEYEKSVERLVKQVEEYMQNTKELRENFEEFKSCDRRAIRLLGHSYKPAVLPKNI